MWHALEIGGSYRVYMVKPDVETSLGRPRHRWEYNIKVDNQELG
jgi:hypothetical protein